MKVRIDSLINKITHANVFLAFMTIALKNASIVMKQFNIVLTV